MAQFLTGECSLMHFIEKFDRTNLRPPVLAVLLETIEKEPESAKSINIFPIKHYTYIYILALLYNAH